MNYDNPFDDNVRVQHHDCLNTLPNQRARCYHTLGLHHWPQLCNIKRGLQAGLAGCPRCQALLHEPTCPAAAAAGEWHRPSSIRLVGTAPAIACTAAPCLASGVPPLPLLFAKPLNCCLGSATGAWGSAAGAWDTPAPAATVSVDNSGARESELNKREAELAKREAELRRMELELRNSGGGKSTKNWPKYCPVVHHDIAGEVPAELQGMVRSGYWAYLVSRDGPPPLNSQSGAAQEGVTQAARTAR